MSIYLNTSYQVFMREKMYKKINTLRGEVENFVSTLIDAIIVIILESITIFAIIIFLFYLYPDETLIILIFIINFFSYNNFLLFKKDEDLCFFKIR